MQVKQDRIQASLDHALKRADALDSRQVTELISEKIFERQLRLTFDLGQKVEYVRYRVIGGVA